MSFSFLSLTSLPLYYLLSLPPFPSEFSSKCLFQLSVDFADDNQRTSFIILCNSHPVHTHIDKLLSLFIYFFFFLTDPPSHNTFRKAWPFIFMRESEMQRLVWQHLKKNKTDIPKALFSLCRSRVIILFPWEINNLKGSSRRFIVPILQFSQISIF